MLFLGLAMLFLGIFGILRNNHEIEAHQSALQKFISQYQKNTDANAIYNKALAIHKQLFLLQNEFGVFPAYAVTMGILFTIWAFDRRNMFKIYTELKNQINNQINNQR